MMKKFLAAIFTISASASWGAETTLYKYDARGRLVQAEAQDAASATTVTTYNYDAADNRIQVIVQKPVRAVVVVPLNGFTVIPIN
jgi:YD repeat-containing protein